MGGATSGCDDDLDASGGYSLRVSGHGVGGAVGGGDEFFKGMESRLRIL